MFKLSIPMKVVLSTGSLTLLMFASLILMSNSVHTSDIQAHDQANANHLNEVPTASAITTDASSFQQPEAAKVSNDNRRRNARVYGGAGSSNHHQSTLDSYAAAYAAANSPGSAADQQSTVQVANDVAYSSFGEPAPSTVSTGVSASPAGGSAASVAPQHSSSYYASYMSPSTNEASYSGNGGGSSSGHYGSPSHHHHYQPASYYKSPISSGAGYSSYERHAPPPPPSYYDRAFASSIPSQHWGTSSMGPTGIMSSASNALSHWTGGFTIGEIICTVVAIAIGAIILGAPFFLIYLALMGNFSGSGTLSLTNPSQGTTATGGATTTTNGRRKRLAIFEQMNGKDDQSHASEFVALADSIVSQLSPFVDIQQVTSSFKRLISSIEKYGNNKNQKQMRRSM